MRLLNTVSGLSEEFVGRNIPEYAILSHTWENEEVLFQDLTDPLCTKKKGYRKIDMTRQMALQAQLSYVWVDTCCIDKSSSAELSEAINSMYRWYQRSNICYAFLSDLPACATLEDALQHCRWFTRGWTLQELIAPKNVHFFDKDWNYRGSKGDIVDLLSRITGISGTILRREQPLSSIAVARRMSWAAKRETTRVEDAAYCLLGLFDVNMPLLYGEEENAFRRLQEEIIKSTPDFSIFAWRMPSASKRWHNSENPVFCGVLAEAPIAFAGCTKITREPTVGGQEFSISNNGVKTRVQVLSESIPGKPVFRYVLPLDCYWTSQHFLGVKLRKCGPDQFVREDPYNLVESTEQCRPIAIRERYLLTRLPEMGLRPDALPQNFIALTRSHALQIELLPEMYGFDAWPRSRFDDEDQIFFLNSNFTAKWDCSSMRLSAEFNVQLGQRKATVGTECMFYAVGWSASEASCLQCTLVDHQSFHAALNEVQSQIVAWDHDRRQVLELLAWSKIPKCSSITVEIPELKAGILLSFKPTRVSDTSVCRSKFWRISFSSEIYKSNDLPSPVAHDKWNLEN